MTRSFPVLAFTAAFCACLAAHAETPWPKADPSALAPGPWKDTVLYGKTLITDTASVLGPEAPNPKLRLAGNNLACGSCHLEAGTQKFALALVGVYAGFPTYIARENEVRTIEDRINGCMERSMNGKALPADSREMKAIVAYLHFLSDGIPVGAATEGRSTPTLKYLARAADLDNGAKLFKKICADCHQPDGQGQRIGKKGDAKGYLFPPLWGPDSFNDGAGMHRLVAAASFIHANMPAGTNYTRPTLTDEDAWDVAAYINAQPRPHRAGLDKDYPDRSRKPVDAPFPPFSDDFPLTQHQLGPFQPIAEAHRGR